jgi:hypothetical protein
LPESSAAQVSVQRTDAKLGHQAKLFSGCPSLGEQKAIMYHAPMDEGRKRVLAIVAGILVARHLKTTEDLFDNRSSPRTESMVAAAVPVG